MLSSLFYRDSIEVMDDRWYMYRDSSQGLRRMNYCNEVQCFINFATSILRNFSGGGIRCLCRKCKNKKYLHLDIVTIHLLHKGFMKDYLCWYAHKELFVRNKSIVKRMVGSTFSASNVHRVVNDNSNPYMNHRRTHRWTMNFKARIINASLTMYTYFTVPTDCENSRGLFKNFSAKFKILKWIHRQSLTE